MKGKKVFFCEIAYIIGIIVLAFGNALMEKADLGMSMVVAPAYIIHLKVSQFLPFFTFGMSGYVFQAFLLVILWAVMRRFKKSYLLSFVTAFIYGIIIDIIMNALDMISYDGMVWRILFYAFGLLICATGVALLLQSQFPPEAYDLFVKSVSKKFNITIGKVKTIYDCCSCVLAVVLSLVFFGTFVGVKWGTIVCALLNGFFIGRISCFLDNKFTFKNAVSLIKIKK